MASENKNTIRFLETVGANLEQSAEQLRRDLKDQAHGTMAEREAAKNALGLVTAGCALANAIVAAFEDAEARNG